MPPVSAPPSPFWGKWGALNPQWAKKFVEMQWNRGYGQPIVTGRYAEFFEPSSRISYYARRFDIDWLKIIAMRVDAARVPLPVLRRQIWIARGEYWFRKSKSIRHMYRAAMVEWAFIKGRLRQPFTWTGRDLVHASFWIIQVFFGFCMGEIVGRENLIGYDVVDPAWQPARPMFAPGFYHMHAAFDDDYPFEKHSSSVSRAFDRGYWPNSDHIYYCPNRKPINIPHPAGS